MRKKKVENLIPATYATSLRCKILKVQECINAREYWCPINRLFLHQETRIVISIFFSCTSHCLFQCVLSQCTFHASLNFY